MKKICKILCAILTLGTHWWVYRPFTSFDGANKFAPQIRCRICRSIPGNQWEIYVKKFKGKKGGKYVTNDGR